MANMYNRTFVKKDKVNRIMLTIIEKLTFVIVKYLLDLINAVKLKWIQLK